MKTKRYVLVLLSFVLLFFAKSAPVEAQTIPVVNDDGNGTQFRQLAANYVQISHLDLAKAEIISGSGYKIEKGFLGMNDHSGVNKLVWTGKINFGGSITTSSRGAVTSKTSLPAVTIRFSDAAVLSEPLNGRTRADILMTLDDISIYATKSLNSNINDNTTVKVVIGQSGGGLVAYYPRTRIDRNDYTASNRSSGAGIAERIRVSLKIVQKGTNTAIPDSVYPTMLVTFFDLDISDKTIKTSASYKTKYDGRFAEGIELISGWTGNAVLAPSSGDAVNRALVNSQITSSGNTKIKGDGIRISAFHDATGRTNDTGTMYSGFTAAVKPSGFSFYWTGSIRASKTAENYMGSSIGGQPIVTVLAKRTGKGGVQSSLGNSATGTKSGVDTWHTNTHIMNSKATYNYKPGSGFSVKYLKVDGADQNLTASEKIGGGSYLFNKLNKYPLPERDVRNGYILETKKSGYYTIEAAFEHIPAYEDRKTADRTTIPAGSSESISYTITSEEKWDDAPSGTHIIHDDMAGGLLHLTGDPVIQVTNGSYTINQADDNGLDITFNSGDASGGKPRITISYSATVNWGAYYASDVNVIKNVCNDAVPPLVYPGYDLGLTKEVEGNLRDTTEKFIFEVVLSGLLKNTEYAVNRTGAEITGITAGEATQTGFISDSSGKATVIMQFKGGQKAVFQGLPAGCTYKITEKTNDHIASYKLVSDAQDPEYVKGAASNDHNWKELATEEEILEKCDGFVTAAFVNSRNTVTITGVMAKKDWINALAVIVITIGFILGFMRLGQSGKAR